MSTYKERKSGVEFLKLIAMLMIVISHSCPYYGDWGAPSYVNLRVATTNIQNLIMVLFVYMGQLGNCMFLACTAYYLLDAEKVRGKKILYLLADCLLVSVAFLLVYVMRGYEFSKILICKQFFPTTFEYNWFVGCYILLYALSPLLNILIKKLSQKQLFLLDMLGVIFYSVLQMLLSNSYYYTRLMGFVLIYFLMAYCKLYLPKTITVKKYNRIVLVVSSILLVAMIGVSNILGLYTDTFREKNLYYCVFVNPFIILIAFSTFFLCKEWKRHSNLINKCASVTLYIYIIHENYLFATYTRPEYFAYIYERFTYRNVALWAATLALGCYVAGLLLGLLYTATARKWVYRICDKVSMVLEKAFERVYSLFQRLD